ncbi:hypothetical protein LTR36_004302 [Oleoguttula mirabilis]|uniref:F-box domain-containing protein n=1 Tax=Oleoguttula mirabilis TaxID=1507867 RepID=A0AAV9JIT8_9PEZI|nr:hypothetical protein LTR36_004302 [Oleoguttula mirabilis]
MHDIMGSQEASILFNLPPELRNVIYELVLQDSTTVVRLALKGYGSIMQQIYLEAGLMFYKCTTFIATNEYFIYTWLQGLHPKYRSALTEIRVDTAAWLTETRRGSSYTGEEEQLLLDMLTKRLRTVCGIEVADGVLKASIRSEKSEVFWTAKPAKDAADLLEGASRGDTWRLPWFRGYLLSLLLALPPELRNTIYELAFSDTIIKLNGATRAWCLLSSCRQIRLEAHGIFYNTVVFEANTQDSAFDHLTKLSPQSRASITHFRYHAIEQIRALNEFHHSNDGRREQAFLDALVRKLKLGGVELGKGVLLASMDSRSGETVWSTVPQSDPRRGSNAGPGGKHFARKTTGGKTPRRQLSSSEHKVGITT